jgi:predicted extracellular nuclease
VTTAKRAAAAFLAAALAAGTVAVAVPLSASAASANIVISQVYGGGGNTGATYKNDFIELYNAGSGPVDLDGWSVQYASATNTTTFSGVTKLSGVLAPGKHYLIQEAAGAGGTTDLPTPDVVGSIALGAGAGKVAHVSSTSALACCKACGTPNAAAVVDFVGFGTANDYETAAAPAPSATNAILRSGGDTDDNSADFTAGAPNPRAAGIGGTLPVVAIRDVQGAGHVSPYDGKAVAVQGGIVTAVAAKGFWIQDPNPDDKIATSEGVYVFTNSAPTIVAGDAVKVVATVDEYRSSSTNLSLTELVGPKVTVLSQGNTLPPSTLIGPGGRAAPAVARTDNPGDVDAAAVFDPQGNGLDFYESMEGMLVKIIDAEVVGPASSFGEIPVLPGGAAAGTRSGRGGIVYGSYDSQNAERLFLDDAITTTPKVNVGDKIPGTIHGVLDSSFGNYKFDVLSTPAVTDNALAREVTREDRRGELSIATYNVENLDPSDPGDKFAELAKGIVTNLKSPDIVALEEVQDNNGATNDGVVDADQTYGKLIAAITAAGGPTYTYRQVNPADDTNGGEPGGNIRVGFLVQTAKELRFVDRGQADATTGTTVVGKNGKIGLSLSPGLIDPTNAAFADSRKPLVGEFRYRGKQVFVIANHFGSKGGDQPLMGRFQPPTRSSETKREAQAQVVRDFVSGIKAADRKAAVVVLGDLNDFEFSQTANILVGADNWLTDLPRTVSAKERYTYVFEGNSQVLDHILVSTALTRGRGVSYDIVHINAEFAVQASDHDPQIVRLPFDNGHWN